MKGYIRFGELPPGGRSYNHISQHFESGVSAFRGFKQEGNYRVEPVTNQEVNELRHMLKRCRNLSLLFLSGTEVGKGSAGEPVLKEVKVLSRIPDITPITYTGIAEFWLRKSLESYNDYRLARNAKDCEIPIVRNYGAEVPDPAGLVSHVLEHGTNTTSRLHGPHHWRLVAHTAMSLLHASGIEVDVPLVFLFSLLHDSKRLTDGQDSEHGKRAADFARELRGEWFHVSEERLEKLTFALAHHNESVTTDDPTVGVCWDADRLNLWRVGIRPQARYLSRPGSEAQIQGARFYQNKDYDWQTIFRFYALPCNDEPTPDPTAADRSDILKAISWEMRGGGSGSSAMVQQWRKWGWHGIADFYEKEMLQGGKR